MDKNIKFVIATEEYIYIENLEPSVNLDYDARPQS